jgi:hypothetical protein
MKATYMKTELDQRNFPEISLMPDWHVRWTAAQAEQELIGFKFTGPGWYFIKRADELDTLLVFPHGPYDARTQWQGRDWPDDQLWNIWVFTGRDASPSFSAICSAPTRVDNR